MIWMLVKGCRISLIILIVWSGCLHSFSVSAQTVTRLHQVEGAISDFCIYEKENEIILSTDQGRVKILDASSFKVKRQISFPSLVDFFGDTIQPMIHSIDVVPETGNLFVAVQGKDGFRDLYFVKNGEKQKLISSESQRIMMVQLIALNNSECLIATLGSELLCFDRSNSKIKYKTQVGVSVFSEMDLERRSNKVFMTNESGSIEVVDALNGNVIQKISDQHLDMVYSVDASKEYIVSGGKDLKLVVRNLNTSIKQVVSNDFPVYCVGIDPSQSLVAFQSDDDNTISIFSIGENQIILKLKKHTSSLSRIAFINQKTLISAGNDGQLIKWNF